MLGACGERQVSSGPAGERETRLSRVLWSDGARWHLSGKALCQEETVTSPCPLALDVPPRCSAMGHRRTRLHQSSKTSAWSSSCWAAHVGCAPAQSCALSDPESSSGAANQVCVHAHVCTWMLPPPHACESMCKARRGVHVALPLCARSRVHTRGACAWEHRGERGRGDVTETHAHPPRRRQPALC